ncbi:MAG: phosphoenolpyruvate--protein phosphotransferase [Deltaproteobacteria bacterium]|nr:phosphoenolpyruvate--protein phosphotransferase [Deltaproteobacteria bacterium]
MTLRLPPTFVPEGSFFKGFGIGTSVVFGLVHLSESLTVRRYPLVSPEAVEKEVERFTAAQESLIAHFRDATKFLPPDMDIRDRDIFEMYLSLLKDPSLLKKTINTIRLKKINAEEALEETLGGIKYVLSENISPNHKYLRERIGDMDLLLDSFLAVLHGKERFPAANFHPKSVVVTKNLSPAELAALPRDMVAGVITENGSPTSHTALLAQALELPAVMGVGGILDKVTGRDEVILDAKEGHVILKPNRDTSYFYEIRKGSLDNRQREIVRMAHIPARTLDDCPVAIHGNLQLAEELPAVMSHGAEAIGLYRTEMMYLAKNTLPTEEELFARYHGIVGTVSPREVTIRTLDLGADKMPLSLGAGRANQNQALGLRAIRFCLKHPDIFRTQLRAILRAAGSGRARIMIPMVSTLDEILRTREILKSVKKELRAEGVKIPKIPFGVMIEVPAAVMMMEELGKHADFFSIGTNDLIQYSMALDRTNPEVTDLYLPLHPSILRMIKIVIDAGAKMNKPVSVCGGMAANAVYAALLVGMGATTLSVPFYDIPKIKRLVRMSFMKDMKAVAAEALKTHTHEDADTIIRSWLRKKFPDILNT